MGKERRDKLEDLRAKILSFEKRMST